MNGTSPLILGWARSAVAPHGGAYAQLHPHDIAAPVLLGLLQRTGVDAAQVDAVVLGNALGAGGNPARMVALAAGLPDRCAAFSIDTQCCAGLDAVAMAAGLLATGQASIVVAGGVEAWSRAPIRQHRPLRPGEPAVAYERPAFAPDPARDPDMLHAAAGHAASQRWTRAAQQDWALLSHRRALAHADQWVDETVPVAGLACDSHPRALSAERALRLPAVVAARSDDGQDCSLTALAVSPRADGAGLVLLASPQGCERLGLRPRARWLGGLALGGVPEVPLAAAARASQALLARHGLHAGQLAAIELHDAFAVQALDFARVLDQPAERLNRRGGGLARGHPIGASAAIALVRLLADLARDEAPGALGLASAAGAGGIGTAALVERLAGISPAP
ncbi:thiolase family protein [Comamonadaceae bacterium PP-2]